MPKLHHINAGEAFVLRSEVKSYIAPDFTLPAGATVMDVGANIGYFSAYVHHLLGGDVRICAFEPMPPVFAVLERNMRERCGARATAFPFGLSDREQDLEFTYFPKATVLSSSRRTAETLETEADEMVARMNTWGGPTGLLSAVKRAQASVSRQVVRRMFANLESQTFPVRVRPLSAVIDELGLTAIDLLKIDVEGAELDVLNGIEDRHWPTIRQLALEVERWTERSPVVAQFLASKNFRVRTEQSAMSRRMNVGLIYAVAESGS